MDPHERSALEQRLGEIQAEIEKIPKGHPNKANVDRWRALLEEQIRILTQLDGRAPD